MFTKGVLRKFILLLACVACCGFTVSRFAYASTSYIGTNDDLGDYVNIGFQDGEERKIFADNYRKRDAWVYNNGNSFSEFTVSNSKFDLGSGGFDNQGSYARLHIDDWPRITTPQRLYSTISVTTKNYNFKDWDMIVVRSQTNVDYFEAETMAVQSGPEIIYGIPGSPIPAGNNMPSDGDTPSERTYADLRDYNHTGNLIFSLGCRAYSVTGTTLTPPGSYYRNLNEIYFRKSGYILEFLDDNNNVTSGYLIRQDMTNRTGHHMYKAVLWNSGAEGTYSGALPVPTKPGFVFAGYEVVNGGGQGVLYNAPSSTSRSLSFSPDGSILKFRVDNPTTPFRYVIQLKPRWIQTSKAESTVVLKYGSSQLADKQYKKTYLSTLSIPNPTPLADRTVYFSADVPNGDTRVTGNLSPIKATRTFNHWDYTAWKYPADYPSKFATVRGWYRLDATGATRGTYTFLGKDNEVSVLNAVWNNGIITLPGLTGTYTFIGWYDHRVGYFNSVAAAEAPSVKNSRVGYAGDRITVDEALMTRLAKGDGKLHAGWMRLEAKYTDSKWAIWGNWATSNLRVVNGISYNPYDSSKGANGYGRLGRIRWNTIVKDAGIAYRVYHTQSSLGKTNPKSAPWLITVPWDFYGNVSNYTHTYNFVNNRSGDLTTSNTGTGKLYYQFQAPAAGYYTFRVRGGAGGTVNGRAAGQAAEIDATVYLYRGQVASGWIGGNGGTSAAGASPYGDGDGRGGSGQSKSEACTRSADLHDRGDFSSEDTDVQAYCPDPADGGASTKIWGTDYFETDHEHAYYHHEDEDEVSQWLYSENGIGSNLAERCGHFEGGLCGDPGTSCHWMWRHMGGTDAKHAYADYHYKVNHASAGGGGATTLYVGNQLFVAAGGGGGATYSAAGQNATTKLSSAAWYSMANAPDSTSPGTSGKGGGQGGYYVSDHVLQSSCRTSAAGGLVTVTYLDNEITDQQGLEPVIAPDLARPNAVAQNSLKVTGITNSGDRYTVSFSRPADNGTTTYFMVSMDARGASSGSYQDSEPVAVTATTGVKGYYYTTDDKTDTVVTVNMDHTGTTGQATGTVTTSSSGTVTALPKSEGTTDTLSNLLVNATHRYLHVAPIDWAGNLGPTTHYLIPLSYQVVFHANNPVSAMSTKVDNRTVAGNTPTQYIPRDIYKNLNKNGYSRYGYSFLGWENTAVQPVYSDNKPNVPYKDQQSVINLAPSGGKKDLYAIWYPHKLKVYYDKNFPNAEFKTDRPDYYSQTENVFFDTLIDTPTKNSNPKHHYIARNGWTFEGWAWTENNATTAKDSTSVLQQGTFYLLRDYDIHLYAIVSRKLRLRLAYDYVTNSAAERSEKCYDRQIWNHSDTFQFRSSDVIQGSTRTKGEYTAIFSSHNKNGDAELHDMVYELFGTDNYQGVSTALNETTGTIKATRFFVGWSDKQQSTGAGVNRFAKLSDYDGTIIGTSGTTFDAKCYDSTEQYGANKKPKFRVYDTKGNKTTVPIDGENTNAANDQITVYPQYRRTYIVLPDATRHDENQETVIRTDQVDSNGNPIEAHTGKKPDKFIGWFTKEQPAKDQTGPGGQYYGSAGDIVRLDSNVTLYPWFNIAPTIIESEIGKDLNDPELGNGFFEGQHVSHDQLLALVDAYDVDNPKETGLASPYIEWNGTKSWIDMYKLNARLWLEDTYPDMSEEDMKHIIDNINVEAFKPTLEYITYYQDGLDNFGKEYPEGVANVEWTQAHDDIVARGLVTSPENVGRIRLHYKITDNGTFVNGVKVMKGVISPDGVTPYTVDSPITVEFDLFCDINYNYHPKLHLISTYMYTGDEKITKDTIEQFLWAKQDASDREDDRDRKPWWYKSETSVALDESIKIIGVYDIQFESGYYNGVEDGVPNKEKCERIMGIKDIRELFALKETDYEAFSHITSFKVEWDCVDQWGKTASGYLMPGFDYEHKSGYNIPNLVNWKQGDPRPKLPYTRDEQVMTREERTMLVIMFNNHDDYDLLHSDVPVAERMRYIDSTWDDYLSADSYWGDADYGMDNLQKIFENYETRSGGNRSAGTKVNNNSGSTVQVAVNDYSDE